MTMDHSRFGIWASMGFAGWAIFVPVLHRVTEKVTPTNELNFLAFAIAILPITALTHEKACEFAGVDPGSAQALQGMMVAFTTVCACDSISIRYFPRQTYDLSAKGFHFLGSLLLYGIGAGIGYALWRTQGAF